MTARVTTLTVRVPLTIRRHGGRKAIVGPDGAEIGPRPPRVDSALVKALVRAHRWRGVLESGAVGTVAELAAAEKINPSYVSRILRLTLLAPNIVEAILDGRQAPEVTLPALMEWVATEWEGVGGRCQWGRGAA